MMLPMSKHQQAALGTSIELLALGFRQRGETIAQYHDRGQTNVEDGTHDALLARRDGRRDKHTAGLCVSNILTNLCLQMLGRKTTGYAHILAPRSSQEHAVANAVVGPGAYLPAEERVKELRTLALQKQATGVVAKIVLPALILLFVAEHQVVVARLEEQAVLGVGSFEGILRLSRSRLWSNKFTVVPTAAHLEATHHHA